MKAALPAILLAILSSIAAPAHGQDRPIFRTIRIADARPLTLGEPIRADVRPLLEPAGRGEFRARRGTFTGANEIHVYTRPDGTVRCVSFVYGPDYDFAEAVAEYRRALGPPRIDERVGRSVWFTYWSDERTSFSLSRHGTNVASMLCEPENEQRQFRASGSVGRPRVVPRP
jgi:hypothetical protein